MPRYDEHLVVFPQIRYIEVLDIPNPRFNEQIWPVPSDTVAHFRDLGVKKILATCDLGRFVVKKIVVFRNAV